MKEIENKEFEIIISGNGNDSQGIQEQKNVENPKEVNEIQQDTEFESSHAIDDSFDTKNESEAPSAIVAPVDEEQTEDAESKEKSTNIVSPELHLLKQLIQTFEEKIKVDSHKNTLFDNLYQELDTYKKDIYSKLLKPFILDTIILIDDLNKLLRDIDSSDAAKLFKIMGQIPEDMLEILERNGVEAYTEDNEDNPVNLRTQTVLKIIQTDDPSLDNLIAEHVRQGYKWDGVILKKEVVNIYKLKQ